jgi:hypothetical protein
VLISLLVDKCNIKSTSRSASHLLIGGPTYSSPAFGGDQSPCAAALVVEKSLLAGDGLERGRVLDCLWALLRRFEVLGGASVQITEGDGVALCDMDRDCNACGLANGVHRF